jgi:alpha-L-rhamnosidase
MVDVQWTARMVTPAVDLVAPVFRREVALDTGHGAVTSAVLHVSSLGVHEAFVDGVPASTEVLSPGWSAYEWRLRYRSHDLTALLGDGSVLTVSLGNGWWRGRLGFFGGRALYGDRLGLIAQLEVAFEDGHVQVVGTDESWTAGPSDTIADDLYDGQTIDARRRDPEWPPQELAAVPMEFDTGLLAPAIGPPVVRHEARRPERIWRSPSGATLVDFGQNLVGWLRFTVQGPRGSEIRVRHAEVLEEGELGVRPLRDAQATDRFVLSGGQDSFEPTFTFHGFRYVEVSGWPGELTADSLEAVVVHSDLRRTGSFECSDPLLTQLHRNVVWGLRGNLLDVPTDCPQRNERLGWTGDLAVFAPSAAYLYDVSAFLQDWLVDLDLEQRHADGLVPFVVPDVLKRMPPPPGLPPVDTAAIWSDAAVWVPWALYQAYGDTAVLTRQYDSMTAHLRRVAGKVSPSGVWDQGFQFGDWLDPDAPPDQPWAAKADPVLVATACLHRSARIVASVAELLERADDAAEFGALADRTREAFVATYVEPDGTVRSDCTTAYTLAIVFDLLSSELEAVAGARLAELVAESGHRISTGFAGTPYVCEALARTGHLDDAYRLLHQRACPSWLYPVTMGATTVWERWDSMLPDGSINPGEMTSFNHYALGAVADWMHRTVAGIAPLEPGYGKVLLAPRPGGDLTWAAASLETRHGLVAIRWERSADELVVETTLPEAVTGVLSLPDGSLRDLGPGTTVVTTVGG